MLKTVQVLEAQPWLEPQPSYRLRGECTKLRLEPASQEMVTNVAASRTLGRDKESITDLTASSEN